MKVLNNIKTRALSYVKSRASNVLDGQWSVLVAKLTK